jgi:gas vesicle protein
MSNNNGKVLLGVLAGVAVGATLGILFAPDKGSNIRKKISKKGEDYAEGLEDKFNEFIESVTQKFESLKQEAEVAAQNGQAAVEDAKDAVKKAVK